MQSSSATIAIFLTALNSELIGFEHAAAAVIGANMGTTITISLGVIGGNVSKKRLASSHLVFNLVTGLLALALFPLLMMLMRTVFSGMGQVIALSAFHTIFNLLGVLLFLPFMGLFAKLLFWMLPEKKLSLTRYIDETDANIPKAAITGIRKEILVMAQRAQVYCLRILAIDVKLVFNNGVFESDFDKGSKTMILPSLYQNIKLMNVELTTYAVKAQKVEFNEEESKLLNQELHSMRYMMDACKTMKDVSHNFDSFESTDNEFVNDQYSNFRRRLVSVYLSLNSLTEKYNTKSHSESLIELCREIEKEDEAVVKKHLKAINKAKIANIEITDLFTVNRLFTRSNRLMLLSLKNVLLEADELKEFELALELKESIK